MDNSGAVLFDQAAENNRPADFWDRVELTGRAPDGRAYMAVMGGRSDGVVEARYQHVVQVEVEAAKDLVIKEPGSKAPLPPLTRLDPALVVLLGTAKSDDMVDVYIDMRDAPVTPLGEHKSAAFPWASGAVYGPTSRAERIAARKMEVELAHADIRAALQSAAPIHLLLRRNVHEVNHVAFQPLHSSRGGQLGLRGPSLSL